MLSFIRALTDNEVGRVQSATEDVLEQVGMRVQHDGLLARCQQAGAQVEEASGVVRFPRSLLRELLAQAPSTYFIRGVDGSQWTVGEGAQHALAIVTDPWIVDYDTQRPRRPRLEDLRRHTVIAAQLDSVVAVSRMDFPVSDVPGPGSSLRALQEHLRYHHKHIYVLAATLESFEQWLQLGQILAQDRPLVGSRLITVGVAVISPLTLSQLNGDLLLRACEHDFPVVPTICPQAGTTSPYCNIGTVLQANAEVVAMAALTQILRPGHPFLYAVGTSVANMRSGHDQYYTLDKVLTKSASVQLGLAYGLPVAAECGGTMTYRYDQQSGAEGMLFMLAAHAAGAHMLAGIGSCYNAIGMSAEMMVIQNAWLAAARFLTRGMDCGLLDASLASIRNAGPGGNYLTDNLTLQLLRSEEFFQHDLFDFSGGCEEGPSLLERAHERVLALTEGYVSRVPERVREELDRWFADHCPATA